MEVVGVLLKKVKLRFLHFWDEVIGHFDLQLGVGEYRFFSDISVCAHIQS